MSHKCQNSAVVKPEPTVVDPNLSLEGMKMDTDSGSNRSSTRRSARIDLGSAISLSGDSAGETFRPLCFSTPEGGRPLKPILPKEPGPAKVSATGAAELNPEAVTFRLEFEEKGPPRKIPKINNPTNQWRPISHQLNAAQVLNIPDAPAHRPIDDADGGGVFEYHKAGPVAAAPSIFEKNEMLPSVSELPFPFKFNFTQAGDQNFAALGTSKPRQEQENQHFFYGPPRINASAVELETSSDSRSVISETEILACTCTCSADRKDEDSVFLLSPPGSAKEIGRSGNEKSYEFGLSGITLLDPAESDGLPETST